MAVTITGSTYTHDANGGDLGSITVPADAEACVVCISHHQQKAVTQLNWNDDPADIDFTEIVSANSESTNYDMHAYIITADDAGWPGAGSDKTLSWAFDAYSDGPRLVCFFVKGLNKSVPTVDTDETETPATSWTASLAGVSAGDLTIIAGVVYQYNIDIDPTGEGQTVIVEDNTPFEYQRIGVAYEDGEGSPNLTVAAAANYLGAVAFAIAAAAAAGDALPMAMNSYRQRRA